LNCSNVPMNLHPRGVILGGPRARHHLRRRCRHSRCAGCYWRRRYTP
jgi:hypothetical protein